MCVWKKEMESWREHFHVLSGHVLVECDNRGLYSFPVLEVVRRIVVAIGAENKSLSAQWLQL